jgi:hypothetical protein
MSGRVGPVAQEAAADDMVGRITGVISGYEAQGFHRTATAVDEASGRWLADQVRKAGLFDNVTAEREGTEPKLPPLVVMTPRSGWYSCDSERGGGIACWLEIIRNSVTSPARRPVPFVAPLGCSSAPASARLLT